MTDIFIAQIKNQTKCMSKDLFYVNVLFAHNISEDFTYKLISKSKPKIGSIVQASLRSSLKVGVITAVLENYEPNKIKIKEIEKVSDAHQLTSKMLKFLEWVSSYNAIQRGLVLKMILSHSKTYFDEKKIDTPSENIATQEKIIELNIEQKRASEKILKISSRRDYNTILLDGVPGSGKTEVYFSALKNYLNEKEQVLIMFPEVSLTSDFVKRIEERFGFAPDVWHSKISASIKTKTLKNIINGTSKIIVGARSALFLPYKKLGMIILDEEHDNSYKQEEKGIYHARDMSVVKASIENIPLILTSATPSLETIFNVFKKKYHKVSIKNKFFSNVENKIKIIDMRKEKLGKDQWVSNPLKNAIEKTISNQSQALLYINKRGYAPVVICKSCGYKFTCKNCTSYLVEHIKNKNLLCHHCGHSVKSFGLNCPSCDNDDQQFIDYGAGIEKIYTEITKLFPVAKICLFSSDHIKSQIELDERVREIKENNYDIIIGTQLITKGYHFPRLTCVGIIDADMSLRGGDLRASEKTYQALYQVAGRAGRAELEGSVFIQTYYPNNETIQALSSLNRDEFYENEINYRVDNKLPPLGKMAAIIVSGNNIERVRSQCSILYNSTPKIPELEVYGPAPAPLSKLKGRHRQRLLIHDKKARNMQKIVETWLSSSKTLPNVNISVDIDPYSFV